MSRIHEALKKAEQERASTQVGSFPPSFATTPVDDHPVFAHVPASTVTDAAARSTSIRCWRVVRNCSGNQIRRPCCF